jgi:ubiquitin-conjugating enzyme E2 J2
MSFLRNKRLQSELRLIDKEPLDNIKVTIKNDQMESWYVLFHGLTDECYVGGEYILEIIIPATYPQDAPDFRMLTPNGRFAINSKLCFSNSGYHPEQWSPVWNMRTIIMGFLSFFLEKESTGIGHIVSSVADKKKFAGESVEYNKVHFPNIVFG